MLTSALPLPRRVFLALAALALLAVLLRPACEAWFAHVGGAAAHAATQVAAGPLGHDGDPHCCANVSDAQRIAPLLALAGGLKAPKGVAPAALGAVIAGIAVSTRQLHWLRAPPRLPTSFYLRSARILR
ncbi:MAG: hypothetical protein OEW90_07730 [Betaproteobacteria bacterium]|nr:hypothetical protein [Betaproteobacteria bacterium]